MRVSIDHKESSTGFLKKKPIYTVLLRVDFSEEELHVIKRDKLEKFVIMERPASFNINGKGLPEDTFFLKINRLLNGKTDEYALSTPAEAKGYEHELVEALKGLKAFLEANQEIEQKSQTFEL